MADTGLSFDGLDKLNAWLLSAINPRAFRDVVEAGARTLTGIFKKYPPVKRLTRREVYGSAFRSDKQRRWFFWALRTGQIEVPYFRGQNPRSENLQQSWAVEMVDDETVRVGTQVSYAQTVMDDAKQSKYMAAVGWRTVQTLMSDADVNATVVDSLNKAIAQKLGV